MNLTTILGSIGGVLVGAIALWAHGRSSGVKSEINKQNKKVLDDIKKSKAARDASAGMSVDDQLEQLRVNSSDK